MKTKLLSLLVCAAGAISAQAAVGDVVTSLSDISSSKVYTLKVGRGYMPNGNGTSQMVGTNDEANAGKFLILKVDEFSFTNNSNYVIYSVDNNKFLTNRSQNTNVYDDYPDQALFNISVGNQANTFIIKSAMTDNWLQFGGSNQFVLTDASWKTQDAGNRWTLTVVDEDGDDVTTPVTAATGVLNDFVGSYEGDIESISNTKKYIIKNVDRAFLNTTATVANASQTNYSEVAILKGSKGYYLYDIAHDKFIGTTNLTSTALPNAHYTLAKHNENSNDKYNFKLTSSSNGYLLQSDGGPTLTITSNWTASDNGNKWAFFRAGTFESGEAMAKINAMEAEVVVPDPIADLAELSTTQKYLLKNIGRDGYGYLKGGANDERLLCIATANASLNDPAYHWEIVNVADEGYVFRNVGTGTYITNYSATHSAGEWKMTNNPVFVYNTLTEITVEATGAKVYAVRNVDYEGTHSYLHVDSNGNTVNWVADAPSQYSIIPFGSVDDYTATIEQALLTAAGNKITSLASISLNPEGLNDRIGYFTTEGNTTLPSVIDAANEVNATADATIHQKIEAVRTVRDAIDNSYANAEAGKYYTIRGAIAPHTEKYLTESYDLTEVLSGTTYNKLVAAALAANPVPAYWSFNKVETNTYNIAAANSGYFMRGVNWSRTCLLLPANHSEIGVYTYVNTVNRQTESGGVTLKSSIDGTLSITNGNYCSDTQIRSHNGNVAGNNWIIELVESVPVSFNEQGYAAVQFPFAVQLPDGVSAYDLSTITAANQAVTTARTGNVVSANTPVLLKGTTSTNLTIVYNAEAAANEVAATLQGTLMPAAVEHAFVLSGDQLVPATDGNVPANSAYYLGTAGDTTPKTLAGDITTAIDELTIDANAANGAVYDLQGRRVSKAAKGLYIINGKKVFVK